MVDHKGEVFIENIPRFDTDERGPRDRPRSFRSDANKAKLEICEEKGQEITNTTGNTGWIWLSEGPPPPAQGMDGDP
jgi:hypothetical protein